MSQDEGGDSGFTLIELLIALLLFALISIAGLALVDSVLGVQGRTEERLDRLADLQRAVMVVTSDVEQVAYGNVRGNGAVLDFTRSAPGLGGAAVPVSYRLVGNTLVRSVGGRPQAVLSGVRSVRWRFFDQEWSDRWPIDDSQAQVWPRAIALEADVAQARGPAGLLRRVIVLPIRAKEAAAQ